MLVLELRPHASYSGLSVESYQRTHDSELLFDQQKHRSSSQPQLIKPVKHSWTDPGFVVLKLT